MFSAAVCDDCGDQFEHLKQLQHACRCIMTYVTWHFAANESRHPVKAGCCLKNIVFFFFLPGFSAFAPTSRIDSYSSVICIEDSDVSNWMLLKQSHYPSRRRPSTGLKIEGVQLFNLFVIKLSQHVSFFSVRRANEHEHNGRAAHKNTKTGQYGARAGPNSSL